MKSEGPMKTRIRVLVVAAAALLAVACGGVSDADLKTKAETALKGDPATSTVTVEVSEGVATISGQVQDEAAKAKAAELANVEGVSSVVNNITVAAAPPKPEMDDATLKNRAEEALKTKNCKDVAVDVSDGKVTLRGSVDRSDLAECIRVVQESTNKSPANDLNIRD